MNFDDITNIYNFKNSLTQTNISIVINELKKIDNRDIDEIQLIIDEINVIELSLNSFANIMNSFKDIDFNEVIMIVFDTMMLFTKKTFIKFLNSRLFKQFFTNQTTSKSLTFVQIGIKSNNEIVDILEFKGSIAQCIEFLNKWRMIYHIKTHSTDSIVMSIDHSECATYEQLVERGLII